MKLLFHCDCYALRGCDNLNTQHELFINDCVFYKSVGIPIISNQLDFLYQLVHNQKAMKSVAFFVLFVTTMIVAIVLGEPVKYRQRARVSAKQTVEIAPAESSEDDENEGRSEQTTLSNVQNSDGPNFAVKPYPSGPLVVLPLDQPLDQPNSDSTTVESTTSDEEFSATTDNSENIGGPYPPSGWKPAGQLLLLPNEEIAVTTTEVPTTEHEQPTTQLQQKNQSGQLVAQRTEQEEIAVADNESEDTASLSETNAKEDAEEIETAEPKKTVNGKSEDDNSSESAEESNSTSTEAQPSSTEQPSSKLETTSEPDSEAVDVEQQPGSVNNGEQGQSQRPEAGAEVPPLLQSGPAAFIIQLPDGSLQRFVFIAAPQGVLPTANSPPNALLPVANSPFQQLVQPQLTQAAQPFGYNPIASPRVVTFSSQYQAF